LLSNKLKSLLFTSLIINPMKKSFGLLVLSLSFMSLAYLVSGCKTEDVEIDQASLTDTTGARGLIINEVNYDPSNVGLQGDANGDGIYNQIQDEFIEIYNSGTADLNISGYTVRDSVLVDSLAVVRFTFPEGTILPKGKACVVFGGGTPTGNFGGSQLFLSSDAAGLSLENTGETINICNRQGMLILSFNSDAQSNNPNESYTLNPDIIGIFVQHLAANPTKAFSPGTKITGANF
jgi:hypothetical protein